VRVGVFHAPHKFYRQSFSSRNGRIKRSVVIKGWGRRVFVDHQSRAVEQILLNKKFLFNDFVVHQLADAQTGGSLPAPEFITGA